MKKSNLFPEYTVENIASRMSLRTPLVNSLKILEDFFKKIDVSKDIDLSEALHTIHSKYPTLTSFEHDFLSLTFAIATGVGKTRLMGAFITYLYTQYNIKNFLSNCSLMEDNSNLIYPVIFLDLRRNYWYYIIM